MNKSIRAKFYVREISYYGRQGEKVNTGGMVKLSPVYGDAPENKAFWDATPSGTIEMSIKTDAINLFELGQAYYVDFTPVKED